MTRKIKLFAGAAAAVAMFASVPASAQYGRYDQRYDPRYDQRYDPYYDQRGGGFDIGTGIAVVGTIATILNAFAAAAAMATASLMATASPTATPDLMAEAMAAIRTIMRRP
jgi:hypothetical protein